MPTVALIEEDTSAAVPSNGSLPLPEHLSRHGLTKCLELISPQIGHARFRVRQGAQRLAASSSRAPFDPDSVEEALATGLAEQLLTMMTRVMVLELNVARIEGRLAGNTPIERFQSFVDSLQAPGTADRLFDEYPVLLEQILNRLNRWAAVSLEFLTRLCDDWPSIRRFFAQDPGLLVGIQSGAGDTHRGGRSVVIASFSKGPQLVYKPRSLAVDEHFQRLLAMFNRLGAQPEFRLLNVYDRGHYGWTEFVRTEPCVTAAGVDRFYRRQGAYVAILYALEASDVHCENLIASGEHPMLIDLEALFHPRVETFDSSRADAAAGKALGYSALRVGLLPMQAWAGDGFGGVDMSGLGSAAGQLTPHAVPHWENSDTDEMRVVRRRMAMPGAANRPSLDGNEVSASDHAAAVVDGFTATYRMLLSHRAELLSQVRLFGSDEVRAIVRPTRVYGTLLHESFHPDVLRSAADRDGLFHRLNDSTGGSPQLARLFASERADLLQGDIPLFRTRPFSRDIWTSADDRVGNYFEESGMTLVENRIQQLSEKDLERQLWIVRASLATLESHRPRTKVVAAPVSGLVSGRKLTSDGVPPRSQGSAAGGSSEWIAAARTIGDRLEELGIGGAEDVTWLGLVPTENDNWVLSPLGPDLYDGLPGVILFLAQLGAMTKDWRYVALAKSALKALRGQIEDTSSVTNIGAFTGWGGIIYALTHLGTIWQDPSLLSEAQRMVGPLRELIREDKQFDIIGGAAGCALALMSLNHCAPSDSILRTARECGDHLLRNSIEMPVGIGWLREDLGPAPLTGFAHGNAGFAYALAELAALTGESRFLDAAHEALRYERSCFSPERDNWPDLRARKASDFSVAWCHGAPGIGLARLCSLGHLDGRVLRSEITAALDTTIAEGFGSNHTLCHGDLGNLDLLLQASSALREPWWELRAYEIATKILKTTRETGWVCGNPSGIESPGLMTGLAGIGYELLRLAAPDQVPQILAVGRPKLS